MANSKGPHNHAVPTDEKRAGGATTHEMGKAGPPPKGTWIAYARSLQNRLQAPDLEVQTKDQPPLGKAARKALVHKYAGQVVWPAVRGKKTMPATKAGSCRGYGSARA